MLLDNIPADSRATYTRVHKLVYLVDKRIREKYNQTTGYQFESFMSHAGPYDKELQADIRAWVTVGLIHNSMSSYETVVSGIDVPTHDARLTEHGKSFFKSTGMNRLVKSLGSQKEIEWLRGVISEYAPKSEKALNKEAVERWLQDHPDKINVVKEFLPFLTERN